MRRARSLAVCGRFSPFCAINTKVAVKLPGCQALRRHHAPCGAFAVSATCSGRNPLGRHSKASRLKHLVVPAATVPGLAAVCLAPQAQADPAPAHAAQAAAATQTGTMSDALSQAGISPAELF